MTACERCNREHTAGCTGHRSKNHATDPGGPCGNAPMNGQSVCGAHGGKAPQNRAKAEERVAEQQAVKMLAKLGSAGDAVTDPIATLCAIAGRAVKFMELLGERVDDLTEIRATDRTGAEQLRAEVAIYERSIGRAASVVEAIVRLGIAERFAKQDAERTAAIVAFIDGVLRDLGHNPRDPEVAGTVARRLELVS